MTHSTTVGTAPELWQRCGPLRVKEKLSPASSRNNLPSTDNSSVPLSTNPASSPRRWAAGFASSNGEARRSIQGGAIRVNDQAVSDEKLTLTRALLTDGVIKLSMGKKKHVLVKPA